MNSNLIVPFIGIASMIVLFASLTGYKGRVNKWSGILSIGRAWLISMGVVSAAVVLCRIAFVVLRGRHVDLVSGFLMPLIFVVIGIIQMRKAFLLCDTGWKKISCVAASFLIAYGFAVKVVFCLLTRVPVSSLYADSDEEKYVFPETITDSSNNEYRFLHTTTSSTALYRSVYGPSKEMIVDKNQLQGNILLYY